MPPGLAYGTLFHKQLKAVSGGNVGQGHIEELYFFHPDTSLLMDTGGAQL